MKKIAIIIAAYNVEHYINECLQSIVAQTVDINDLQIIIVNDGSTDNTERIAIQCQQSYPASVVVISQVNKGLAAARNAAMAIIDAEFTLFLDADDRLPPTACEALYHCAITTRADLVIGKMQYFPAGCATQKYDTTLNASTWLDLSDPNCAIPVSAGGKLFASKTIERIRFNTTLAVQEDVDFNMRYILRNGRIYFINEGVYLYRKRAEKDSLIDKIYHQPPNYFGFINHCVRPIFMLLRDSSDTQQLKQIVINHLLYPLAQYVQHLQQYLSDEDADKFIEQLRACLQLISDTNIANFYDIHIKAMLFTVRSGNFQGHQTQIKTELDNRGAVRLASHSLGVTPRIAVIDKVEFDTAKLVMGGFVYLQGLTCFSSTINCLLNGQRWRGQFVKCDKLKIQDYGVTFDYSAAGFRIEIPLADVATGFHPISLACLIQSASYRESFVLPQFRVALCAQRLNPVYSKQAEFLIKASTSSLALQVKPIANIFLAKCMRKLKNRLKPMIKAE